MKNYLNRIFFLLAISICLIEVNSEATESEVSLLVHKTPTCGCCKMWVEHLNKDRFSASVQDHKSLQTIKEKHNIKPKYQSCHTGVSKDGYIFEGHIPNKFIAQFLSEDHPNAIGLSVPGMPLGSPGMEVDGMFTPYDVLILFNDGSSKVYAEVRK